MRTVMLDVLSTPRNRTYAVLTPVDVARGSNKKGVKMGLENVTG